MVTIRRNVFETNSSSCHSITIVDDVASDHNGTVLYACGDDFGWERDTITSHQKKFSYWCVAALDRLCDLLYIDSKNLYLQKAKTEEERTEIELGDNSLQKSSIVKYDDKVRYIRDTVGDYFSKRGVEIIWDDEDENWFFNLDGEYHTPNLDGYIDHQSAPCEDSDCRNLAELWKDPEALYNFVFGDSYIVTDNDNH